MTDQGNERLVRLEIVEFDFDARNLAHLAPHGIDANLIYEIASGQPVFRLNPPTGDRSGTHRMIGPDSSGRIWTVILIPVDDEAGIWRPITGWPSTTKEVRTWRGAV